MSINAAPKPDAFSVGDLVALRIDETRTGPVIAVLPAVGGIPRYRVFHSSSSTREYAEDQLVGVQAGPIDPWADDLVSGDWVVLDTFRARLVAARLANPQVDHIYALQSARIQFIPFQFKPLLRLLRSDRPRLLIADDVGVGKTIEAGLILKELSTRQGLDRVLVMSPKALTTKWRAEMRRFDEDFRVLDSRSLRYCLDEVALEGRWPAEYSRAIVHYELARMEPYLLGTDRRTRRHPGLLELDPGPRFDLVIADEAHHVRTPGTGSHQLMEYMCEAAEAVLMLTATPVQVSSDNLFVLLSLLRPDLFPDRAAFRDVTEPNQHITRAIRTLRIGPAAGPDWLGQVHEALTTAAGTAWGLNALTQDPSFNDVLGLVGAGITLADAARVRCIRELEEAHSLAHVMNRTRRRDIGRFTIREPRTVSVDFTVEQREFYGEVLAFRRRVLLEEHPPQVVNLILDTLERQAASSITALAQGIEQLLSANGFSLEALTDDPEYVRDHGDDMAPLTTDAAHLLALARTLPSDDPKAEALLDLVRQTMDEQSAPGKLLVFSFFLHTLAYLERLLRDVGVRVRCITGQTADDEREDLRDRFRLPRSDPHALDVLLSSEVGCEGLDYEFCDRLVNYDIPWNPMRLEQRIGRIDRFGQQSEKVLIFNFVTPDTVEDRVFFRCYERLGVFRDTVGDLEEVLGPMVVALTEIALTPSLTPEQAEEQARQAADNAIRLADEQRRLDQESGALLGLDDAFTSDVGDVVDHARFVSASDLELLVGSFLSASPINGRVTVDGEGRRTLRLPTEGRDALGSLIRGRESNRLSAALLAAVGSGQAEFTFDQATATANRSLDFVTPVHPLARLAVAHWSSAARTLVAAFRLGTATTRPGRYLVVCERWETLGARPEVRLECLAADLETGELELELGAQFLGLLVGARPPDSADLAESKELVSARLHDLVASSDERRRATVAELLETNNVLVDRRLASLRSYYDNRIRRVQNDLTVATEPRILRMKTAELERAQSEFARRVAALEASRAVDVLSERVAACLVEVVPE